MFSDFRVASRIQMVGQWNFKQRSVEIKMRLKVYWTHAYSYLGIQTRQGIISLHSSFFFFFIDTFVSLAIPSLQLRLTTSLFSNLDSKLENNSQYLSIVQCRVLVFICSHILLRSCLAQIPLALLLLTQITTRPNTVPMAWSCWVSV
jgi:hypothetical protein